MRLPFKISQPNLDQSIQWMKAWLEKTAQRKPEILNRFIQKSYCDIDTLTVGKRIYQLKITLADRKTHKATLEDNIITIDLSRELALERRSKIIKTLLSRIIGKDYLPHITERVHYLNRLHFNQKIKSVKLNYAHSRWGSCSSKGSINLSTRLLFAPQTVIDYVIIHELAHLLEPNHSPGFWKLVKQAMPNYKEQEKWLKENGHLCDF